MKTILFLTLTWFSWQALAVGDYQGCGDYSFHGKVIKNDKQQLIYIVHEGTRSQLNFHIEDSEASMLAAYLNKPTSIIAIISTPMDGTHGRIKKIRQISPRLPDPLVPEKDSFIELKTKKDCEK